MPQTYDFYFDFGSLASYLAYTQLGKIEAETNARPNIKPMLLGAVFKATGNSSPVSVPAKGKYMFTDFNRFANTYGVPLKPNPYFPITTTTLMRMMTGLQMRNDPRVQEFMDIIFKAIWVDALNLNEEDAVSSALTRANFDALELLTLANEPSTKDRLKEVTNEAIARGVFGAPTFFVGDEMFWGQDRIEQVKKALRA
jgi:2-hydroxychromene-2-carboxylate isomerase